MTFCGKTRESSVASEFRGRLFSATRPNSSTAAKRALGLNDDRKCSDLSSNESLSHSRNVRNVHITDHLKGEIRRVLSSQRNHNFKNDRVILVTNQVPFYMFSNIPFSKNSKSAGRTEIRKEGTRRRNTSGPRPLSAINDGTFDAFGLLGMEKAEMGQDLSYGHLLIPSRHHQKDKKISFPFPVESELTHAHLLKNFGFGRCVTYDGLSNNRILSTSPSALHSSTDLKHMQTDEAQDNLNDTKVNMVCSHAVRLQSYLELIISFLLRLFSISIRPTYLMIPN